MNEPRHVITEIERTFGHDMDAWLACFDEPMVLIAPGGTMTFATRAEATAFFTPQWEALRAAGFHETVAGEVSVQQLADDVALVDAHFTRRRADGSAMEQLDALYVCRRRADRWLVAALVRH